MIAEHSVAQSSVDTLSDTEKNMSHDAKSPNLVDLDNCLVDFEGPDDLYRPLNWSMRKRSITTILYSICTMAATWASSCYNPAIAQVGSQFGISTEVSLLGLSLYLLGNAFGPLLWAPMSEAYGRKTSVLIPIFGLMVFSFATGASKDIHTLFITRFFGGVFGSAPLCNVGGVLADIWPATQRGTAMLLWGCAVITGPLVAPIVGAALVTALPSTGWRWTQYLVGIMLAMILSLGMFLIDETSAPILLARKADKIRQQTKNWAIHSKSQETSPSFKAMSRKYLIVPIEMLIDPIAFLINLYASFVYAIIYLAITSLPLEFEGVRRWNAVNSSLPCLAVLVGVVFACCVNFWGQGFYNKRWKANGNKGVPEARLAPMMVGSFFFPAGLFIMGWTSSRNVPWIGFCVGAACIGLGFFTIFQSSLNYLVDTYLMTAASALAASMFMRSVLAAGFPLFSRALLARLGLDWGLSLLGFIALAMVPIPFLFYVYGKRIRARGKRSKASVN